MAWLVGRGRAAPAPAMRPLADEDLASARALCAHDPVGSMLAAAKIQQACARGTLTDAGGALWGLPATGDLRALLWVGGNVVPVNPHRASGFHAAAAAVLRPIRALASMVGPALDVLPVWRTLGPGWITPRAVREHQLSMVMRGRAKVPAHPAARQSQAADFADLLPACVEMFTGEIGYSPLQTAPVAYPARVRALIGAGRSWMIPLAAIVPGSRGIAFKAEIGAYFEGVAQLQGVWVNPRVRGQGIGTAGVAAIVNALAERQMASSLYVNDFNAAAIRAYERVGFRQVGEYATVIF
ncbi:DUF4081 domain-containing GNAT family N-acetyltransferase [Rarobacter incanus]|uniref:N-acetyltransferase domain-containing protein n=1 Tax=Rarobacter incanus TaxID=153494 RepID=A0A542SLJ9_9MICO|nr:DUF4081 domain-containing GNAT family N-acetyltransferase [Rarobacter incanus]TQK75438.1 hypothetical protein FB389_0064 [Rarobacter incanus]